MANWYGTSRSNYFRVKDEEAFRVWAGACYLDVWTNSAGAFALAPDGNSDGGWPSFILDDAGDEREIDLLFELAEHLADGEVAVLMTVGAEKLRYVTGFASAVTWDGRTTQVSISDIYDRVRSEFGIEPTPAEY